MRGERATSSRIVAESDRVQALLIAKINGLKVVGLPLRNEKESLATARQSDWHERARSTGPSGVGIVSVYAPDTPYCCSICCALKAWASREHAVNRAAPSSVLGLYPSTRRPLSNPTTKRTIAMTSRAWTNAPIVYVPTIPSNHATSRMTAMVYSI